LIAEGSRDVVMYIALKMCALVAILSELRQ